MEENAVIYDEKQTFPGRQEGIKWKTTEKLPLSGGRKSV